jgi:ATP-binding cassette, subfamily B, bacterial PglK
MSTARKIYGLLTPAERRSGAVLLALMVAGMGLEMLGVGVVLPAIVLMVESDVASAYPTVRPWLARIGNPTQVQLVAGGMIVLVVIYLIRGLFLGFLIVRQMRFAFGAQADLSNRLFGVYLRQPYAFHLQRNSAQLIVNLTSEIRLFTFTAMLPLMVLLTEGLVLAGIIALLLILEPAATLLMVTTLGAAAWCFDRLIRMRIARAAIARQHHDGQRLQHLQQGLGGVKAVKLHGREREFLSRHDVHNVRSARALQVQQTLQQLPRLWLEFSGAIALACVVVASLWQGRSVDTLVPALGLFSAAGLRLMPSVHRLMGSAQYLRSSLPVINALHAELQLPVPAERPEPAAPWRLRSRITVDNVTFSYASTPTSALQNISFEVQKNECIGLIGPSGSGKSTLVDVILGLLEPDEGRILVDDHDIATCTRAWQNQIGYVPQVIFLTDDTIRRNVAFGVPDDRIDDAAVARAIQSAQLQALIADLPAGVNTMVGEDGVRLSGGQRQRIGIARALYHDPSVLVLDEATSSLDTQTERDVMESVRALQGHKTILIVAHRLSTVERCDRLYYLEHGRIVREGAPVQILGN